MAISNDILSSTIRIVKDKAVDNMFRVTPLLEKIREKGGVEEVSGGSTIDRSLILADHSAITQYTSGFEPKSSLVADAMRNASYEFCDFSSEVSIARMEELANQDPHRIVSLAEARTKQVLQSLKREFEKQAVAGNSTILTRLSTLAGGVSTTGFLESEAFGSQTNTVGGLVKSAYATAYQNQKVDAASSLSIDDLTDLAIQCQIYAPGDATNLILTSPLFYRTYKGLLYAREQYIKETVLDGGRLALAFAGAMMYVDPFLPVTFSLEAGTPVASAYFLNTEHLKLVVDKKANFEMSDFENVSGYNTRQASIYCRMQLVVEHLASQGVLLNGEA